MVKVKDYIEHSGYYYSDPGQCLTCSMCIPITMCPIYSLTAGIILFKNCEFGFFYLT